MTARIYRPAKTAMQSGQANTKDWVVDFEPEVPRQVEPLMGWTSSFDTRAQVQLRFETKDEAVAYCEALVQRTPDPAADGTGRKFVVIFFRWLGPTDV